MIGLLLIMFQAIGEIPVRQWTLQDIMLIGGAALNISAVVSIGSVALHRLGRMEHESERVRAKASEIADALTQMKIEWEHRVTLVEEKASAAHTRLDRLAPNVDWGRIMVMFEKVLDHEAEKSRDMKDILERLSEKE